MKNISYKAMILFWSILFLAITSHKLTAQTFIRDHALSAFVITFTKYIYWPEEASTDSFRIAIISENKDFIAEIHKLTKNVNIKGKPLKITVSTNPGPFLKAAHMVVITAELKHLYLDIFDIIEGQNVLLVSENYDEQRFVLINLFDKGEDQLSFEINQANIINQGLLIDDELLLLGGSAIDVARLYRTSQQSLRSMSKKLAYYQNQIDSVTEAVEIARYNLKKQTVTMLQQADKIDAQELIMDSLSKRFALERYFINKEKEKLIRQKDSSMLLTRQAVKKLNDKLLALDNIQHDIGEKNSKISELNTLIEIKESELGKQTTVIERQQNFMILLAIILGLILVIILLIYRAYQQRQLLVKRLKEQNVEIEAINEELYAKNDELNDKNEILSSTIVELKETQKKLVESEKMASLGVLTAGIAHEINNPINFVYAGVNSLKKDFADLQPIYNYLKNNIENPQNPQQIIDTLLHSYHENDVEGAFEAIGETLLDIELGASLTAEIVNGLRNFSRMEKEELQNTDVHERINDALILLKNKYKNHIEISKDYQENLPYLLCYPGKINQVFLNILSNAIDAIDETQQKGEIKILSRNNNDYIELKFIDNGKGMNTETQASIFDPFFTTKEVGKGVGLGMSISYSIIKEHNGEIFVESKQGNGTTFTIRLPLKKNVDETQG